MSMRCVALLSGGLDSKLAIRLMQEQGIEVEAVNFKTVFTCCQDQSAQAARELSVRLTVISPDDDYLDIIERPRFGYGKGANPCVDCRIYMFRKALVFMDQVEASFLVSGEVVGQRPMSQKQRDLLTIAHHSTADDLLLRPLSAKLLPPTRPEREGWVDREQLYDFVGRNRKPLIELARRLGIENIPTPSNGCALTEPQFSRKVFDLIDRTHETAERWDYEMLKLGRHFRFSEYSKVIVGRREAENEAIEYMYRSASKRKAALVVPESFHGPVVMIVGEVDDEVVSYASSLAIRYSNKCGDLAMATVRVVYDETERIQPVTWDARALEAASIASA